MTIDKINGGDMFRVGEKRYRAMYKQSDAWGCRIWDGKSWAHTGEGGYFWFKLDTEIEGYEKFTPVPVSGGNAEVVGAI